MALSDVAVCNRALRRAGQSQTLAALSDNSSAGRACNDLYADARDTVLEARPWPFAMRRATLAALSGVTRDGWLFVYPFPKDCIAPRYIFNPALAASTDVSDELLLDPVESLLLDPVPLQSILPVDVPFIVESDASAGNVILSNQATPVLVYTARVTAAPLFSQHFTDALAWYLAADLALSLAKKPALADRCTQKYEWALARAGRTFNNQKPQPRPVSTFERHR